VTVAQPTAAYTSPLSRCVRTAEIIAQPHGLAPQPLAQLSDIDYGAWQGRTFEDVRKSAPEAFADWLRRPHFAAIPGGEALDGVAMRVAGVLRLVLSQHSSETVLLVGHDSVNRVMLLLALEMPIDHYWSFRQSPCGLSILDDNDAGGWVATCVNETAHLAGVVSNR
jgi:probable phosphoglycerate mutase